MSETQKSLSEHQELTQEAQQHLTNLEALVRFRELHPEIFATIAPKVKAVLTEGENPIVPVLSEEAMKEQILTKPRKNKYGLVMDPLEQELDDIKFGLNDKDIERYQGARYEHLKHGKEDAVQFFNRVYGKYREAECIFQDDLLAIDQKLYRSLVNLLDRKDVKDKKYGYSLADFLPTSSHRVALIQGKVAKIDEQELSYFAGVLKRNSD